MRGGLRWVADDEEVYYAMYQVAKSMSNLGEPWPDVEDAYLQAWQIRPTRAEPLLAIAFRCRVEQRYKFAYLFAESAAKIPLPEEDNICQRGRLRLARNR